MRSESPPQRNGTAQHLTLIVVVVVVVQDVRLKPGSLLRFVNNSPMPPEQHFYPSSLAFGELWLFFGHVLMPSYGYLFFFFFNHVMVDWLT